MGPSDSLRALTFGHQSKVVKKTRKIFKRRPGGSMTKLPHGNPHSRYPKACRHTNAATDGEGIHIPQGTQLGDSKTPPWNSTLDTLPLLLQYVTALWCERSTPRSCVHLSFLIGSCSVATSAHGVGTDIWATHVKAVEQQSHFMPSHILGRGGWVIPNSCPLLSHAISGGPGLPTLPLRRWHRQQH